MTKPHPDNFCGGNFADWLEVMLTSDCNAHCPWCIDKNGYHPKTRITTSDLVGRIAQTKKTHIILLGGEPTLHPDIGFIINTLSELDRKVYVTTNGTMLTPTFVKTKLLRLTGLNISIHNNHLGRHSKMTGANLNETTIRESIAVLQKTQVRLNCNLILGHIDSRERVDEYIDFAKRIGAHGVRFAELKDDLENWVDMLQVFGSAYGVNNNPFGLGCIRDVTINGMAVNLRQMCGLQTPTRIKPRDPEQVTKQVLYYDGRIYNGWQQEGGIGMDEKECKELLETVKSGDVTVEDAVKKLIVAKDDGDVARTGLGGGCCY